jgi:hypothetical protein
LPGNITVEIFLNDLIRLIEYNKDLKLDFSLCDQAFITAQRCAKKKCISHTLGTNLWYQNKFQAEVRRIKSYVKFKRENLFSIVLVVVYHWMLKQCMIYLKNI